MACFLIPTAEAIVTTAATKIAEKNETGEAVHIEGKTAGEPKVKNSFIRKLKWLNYMLWGGAALLAFEHVWHGEVVPWFPFLTAAGNPADRAVMLHEMGTAGVCMAVLTTVVWAGMVVATNAIEKRDLKAEAINEQEV